MAITRTITLPDRMSTRLPDRRVLFLQAAGSRVRFSSSLLSLLFLDAYTIFSVFGRIMYVIRGLGSGRFVLNAPVTTFHEMQKDLI